MLKAINIIIPSYGRAGRVKGYGYFPMAKIYVPESQEAEYLKHYDRDRIVSCLDTEDGNIARKRNSALDRFSRPLLFLDDDLECLMVNQAGKMRRLNPEEAEAVIVAGFNLAFQWGCMLWGVNVNTDAKSGQPYKPFSLTSMILGPFMGFLGGDLRFDESLSGKEDYDLSLAALNKYRKILRFNFVAYKCSHGVNDGGLVSMRTLQFETEACRRIEKKWSRQIIRYPLKPKKLADLLNADVCVPIAGV